MDQDKLHIITTILLLRPCTKQCKRYYIRDIAGVKLIIILLQILLVGYFKKFCPLMVHKLIPASRYTVDRADSLLIVLNSQRN